MESVQEILGHRFKDLSLLQVALTHASNKSESHPSNERLEFLGDAILGAVVSEYLYAVYPGASEGRLTQIKSVVVSAPVLAEEISRLSLYEHFDIGKGMANQEELPISILANLFEALVAALYLDAGLDEARRFILDCIKPHIGMVERDEHGRNYKSILQHYAQKEFNLTPTYRVLSESGPDHLKVFEVVAVIGTTEYGRANGRSKKEAEQGAAASTLEIIRFPSAAGKKTAL
ncbi:MAG: ribonuclease III [Planctomycetota bacterium]